MGARIDNTIAVIPSYNEVRTIGEVVSTISDMGMTVLVIDDGSVDNTERVALDAGAMVIRHKKNRGKGYSVREGLKHVINKTKFEWMVLMDGDGQHHPEDILSLMGAVADDEADMVIGNRMLETKNMPPLRFWTNKFTSWVVSGICGQIVPDTQCGYRLIRVEVLRDVYLMTEKYDIESEMLIQAARKGVKITSARIQTIYGDEESQIHPVKDAIRFFKLIFKHHLESGPGSGYDSD
ncbi:MAG: glycosyltransferase [Candidatus Omnitrophica bacterium]|nr:glycosyltransferase [Candidatus Omnitrophota bacterium]